VRPDCSHRLPARLFAPASVAPMHIVFSTQLPHVRHRQFWPDPAGEWSCTRSICELSIRLLKYPLSCPPLTLRQDEFAKFIFGCADAVVLIGVTSFRPPTSVLSKLVDIIFNVRVVPCCSSPAIWHRVFPDQCLAGWANVHYIRCRTWTWTAATPLSPRSSLTGVSSPSTCCSLWCVGDPHANRECCVSCETSPSRGLMALDTLSTCPCMHCSTFWSADRLAAFDALSKRSCNISFAMDSSTFWSAARQPA
jgi:hypothetical protein